MSQGERKGLVLRGTVQVRTDDDDEESATPEELVGEFRQFLDTVRPEDFSS